jgi:hypothetical protein
VDFQLESVEGDGAGVLGDIQVDDDRALVGQLVEVGVDSQVVMARHHVGGQQLAALDRGRGGLEASSGSTHGGAESSRGTSS